MVASIYRSHTFRVWLTVPAAVCVCIYFGVFLGFSHLYFVCGGGCWVLVVCVCMHVCLCVCVYVFHKSDNFTC